MATTENSTSSLKNNLIHLRQAAYNAERFLERSGSMLHIMNSWLGDRAKDEDSLEMGMFHDALFLFENHLSEVLQEVKASLKACEGEDA